VSEDKLSMSSTVTDLNPANRLFLEGNNVLLHQHAVLMGQAAYVIIVSANNETAIAKQIAHTPLELQMRLIPRHSSNRSL
jgi:hypothetical protein